MNPFRTRACPADLQAVCARVEAHAWLATGTLSFSYAPPINHWGDWSCELADSTCTQPSISRNGTAGCSSVSLQRGSLYARLTIQPASQYCSSLWNSVPRVVGSMTLKPAAADAGATSPARPASLRRGEHRSRPSSLSPPPGPARRSRSRRST